MSGNGKGPGFPGPKAFIGKRADQCECSRSSVSAASRGEIIG